MATADPLRTPSASGPARSSERGPRVEAASSDGCERARTAIVGIVNVTPDSFSDGGLHATAGSALAHAHVLLAEGADVLDVGGESTRPGASPVPAAEQVARVVPLIAALRGEGVSCPISVDTRSAEVAERALRAGATLVNDVSAGTADPAMLDTVARLGGGIVLMHMQGEPRTMQVAPRYDDVVREVLDHLRARASAAERAGVPRARVFVDPGIGFGKAQAHNEALLRALETFVEDGRPVWLGASRKGFLGAITGRSVDERLAASLACAARGVEAGVAAVRVHDVAPTRDLLRVLGRIGRR